LNKISAFLFITCLLCFTPALWSADPGVYNSDNRLSGAQSQSIGEEETEAKDPLLATVFSVAPGIVFHGFGNFYAGNYDDGTRMITMEILGGGLSAWGYAIIHDQSDWGVYFGNETPNAGYWIKAAGIALVAVSWIWDVSTAADAAESFNKDHQVNFQLESRYDGVQLALTHKF
jgi:hypothetical protein